MDEETFEQLRALVRLAREHRLSEVKIESAEVAIDLRRDEGHAKGEGQVPAVASRAVGLEEICAPLIGVFYRAPAPNAPPYIEVGDWIEPGQTVGLIEAMKVFNEINSEIEGRVVSIAAQNGALVQAGEVLMVVEPTQ